MAGDHEDQAQNSYAHIVRPFADFTTVYQGESSARWIMLQEGNNPLDPSAGQDGYAPGLLRGLRVPFGARITMWFPHIYTETTPANPYRYRWMYRLRNLFESQVQRGPWHLTEVAGVTDTTPVTGGPRTLKPAVYRSFCLPQAEPSQIDTTQGSREQFHTRPADVDPISGNPSALPLLPDGTSVGVVQQGVLDPADFGPVAAGMPSFVAVSDIALGDEILFAVSRDTTIAATWDFASPGGVDLRLSRYFAGSPTIGIYVFIGKIPSSMSSFA